MGRLFWKIFLSLWLTLLITGGLVGALVWQYNKAQIEELEMLADGPRAYYSIKALARVLRSEGVEELHEVIEHRGERTRRPLAVMIVNQAGKDILGRPVSPVMLAKAREALNDSEQSNIKQVITPKGEQFLLFVPRREFLNANKLNSAHEHHKGKMKAAFPRFLPGLPLFIALLGSLLFSAGLAWYITQPIRHLRKATNQFAEGKLETRVMHNIGKRKDEIADLAMDFDNMAEQVQLLVATQKRLLNDVSHELRSPLARLRVAIEMGRQQPDKSEEVTQRIEKESQRLDELVGELLTLSRLEANIQHHEDDYFDLNGLVKSIKDDAQFEATNQNKQISLHSAGEILIKGSIELLRRAIENVLRNAIYYSPENTEVSITLSTEDNDVIITVCDSGRGIEEEKLADLFQPFVRINENQQNIKIPGYGLGLAIARRAVELHCGEIKAYNQKSGGLCIEARFPLNK